MGIMLVGIVLRAMVAVLRVRDINTSGQIALCVSLYTFCHLRPQNTQASECRKCFPLGPRYTKPGLQVEKKNELTINTNKI